jgi:preprotein translocase subunit YajC
MELQEYRVSIRNRFVLPLLALGLAAATPAAAQIAAGAAVKDTGGGVVGTVVRVDGDHLIVKTDRNEARLPASSFTPVEGGLLFGMTQAQLNAAIDKAKAEADAKIAPGAAVTGAAGAAVGTIQDIDAEYVTLKLKSGGAVRVPRAAVAASDKGVVTSLTVAELEAAAKGAGS